MVKKIFSNKISYKKLKYTSDNLTMRARHFYCANFIKEQFSKKIIQFVTLVQAKVIL